MKYKAKYKPNYFDPQLKNVGINPFKFCLK